MESNVNLCPCGKQTQQGRLTYQQCCQLYHMGSPAPDAETLMRSRYSAFVLKQHDYLIHTHDTAHLAGLTKELLDKENLTQWLGLQVNNFQQTGDDAIVEFHAWYREDGLTAIHEISHFHRRNGLWLYTWGNQLPPKMPKRNEPCLCHSGKKFKQCCLAQR